jgi:acyl carrier protein
MIAVHSRFKDLAKRSNTLQEQVVLDRLRAYVSEQILQDSSVVIEPDTPLLEWGILNSISTVQLIGYIREQFQVEVPAEEVAGRNFKDLRSIGQLLAQLEGK